MTREEILAMKPGRELDALVAEKVMGMPVHWERAAIIGNRLVWVRCEPYRVGEMQRTEDGRPIPAYSTDIAAWEVVEEMVGQGFDIDLSSTILSPDFMAVSWSAMFSRFTTKAKAMAEAVAEAICKAALLAVLEEQPMG